MNKILSFVLILLLSVAAVAATPVTVQDGNLNLSKNLTVQGNEIDSIHVKTSSGSSIFRVDALNDVIYTGLLRPRSDANYDVGQSTNKFKNAYFSGNLTASNVCYSNGTNCVATGDTNETTRFNALVNTDCSGTDKAVGVDSTGNVVCATDVDTDTQKKTNGFYLTNDSTTIYFDEAKLNQTIDLRDDDTTYTNGTGLSLVGTTFSVVLSYFQGLFLELTDSFSGDVSGTYDNLQIADNSHNLHWDNVSNKPTNLDTDSTNDLSVSSAFGGDVSGTYDAIAVTDNSHLLNYNNITGANNSISQLINDTTNYIENNSDVTVDDLQVARYLIVNNSYNDKIWFDGSQISPHTLLLYGNQGFRIYSKLLDDTVALFNNNGVVTAKTFNATTKILSNDWSNVTLTATQLSNLVVLLATIFGGDVSGTYDAIIVTDNSHLHKASNVTDFNHSASLVANDTGVRFAINATNSTYARILDTGNIYIDDDIDKEHIEGDLNTFVDIAGDEMTGRLNITVAGTSSPSENTGTVLKLQRNDVTTRASGMSIIGGTAGFSFIDLGDTNDVRAGGILYSHSLNEFRIIANNRTVVTINNSFMELNGANILMATGNISAQNISGWIHCSNITGADVCTILTQSQLASNNATLLSYITSGDLEDTGSMVNVRDNSLLLSYNNITGANATVDLRISSNPNLFVNSTHNYNSTQLGQQLEASGGNVLGIKWSWFTDSVFKLVVPMGFYNSTNQQPDNSMLLTSSNITNFNNAVSQFVNSTINQTSLFGDVTGNLNQTVVSDNSHKLHWDNITNKPANLDTDSTDDLTTSTNFGGDVSGTYDAVAVADNSVLLNYNNITEANSSVSRLINDTTDYIGNNTDGIIEDLRITGSLSVGSPENTPYTGWVFVDDGSDIARYGENIDDFLSIDGAANNARFYLNGGLYWDFNITELSPASDNQQSLGSLQSRFKKVHSIAGRFNVTSEDPSTYPGTVIIRGKEALRIQGSEGSYLHGGQLNFGDGDYAYIRETNDDLLEIRGNAGIRLNGTVTIKGNLTFPGIAPPTGKDYVCISSSGQFSSGASCTKFENLKSVSGTMPDDDFVVTKIVEQRYLQSFPVEELRGKVYNYVYTVEFNLLGQKMSGVIKVPGNMAKGEIPYYLKSKIESERGINSIQEVEVQNDMIKNYKISEINSIEQPNYDSNAKTMK